MNRPGRDQRGQTEAIGTVLMVALAIVAVGLLGFVAMDFVGVLGGPSASTVVDLHETDAGMQLNVEYAGQNATVRINGEQVASIDGDDAGRSIYLPTAPGDRVTVLASSDDRGVLLSETLDRGRAGDFVGYYTFETGGGTTLVDRSSNDNNGTIYGASWANTSEGESLRFDGSDDYVRIHDVGVGNSSEVRAFTVVIKFNVTAETGSIQQLAEHRTTSGNEWFLETPDTTAPYDLQFAVNYPSHTISTSTQPIGLHETHVAVATFDGHTYDLYIDGSLVAQSTFDRNVEMGQITMARDDERSIQFLAGHIHEFRIYYTAFDGTEVETITEKVE
jgi:flagellin-like protein